MPGKKNLFQFSGPDIRFVFVRRLQSSVSNLLCDRTQFRQKSENQKLADPQIYSGERTSTHFQRFLQTHASKLGCLMLKTPLFFFYKQGSLVRTFVGNSLGADANDNIFSCTVKVHYSLSFSITNIIMCCKFGILYKFLKTKPTPYVFFSLAPNWSSFILLTSIIFTVHT